MNIFPWKKKPTPEESQEILEQIKNILFPPLELQETSDNQGNRVKFSIDYAIDSNLYAALVDLQDGSNDKITQKTISKAIDRLYEVKKLLGAESKIHKESTYVMVDDPTEDKENLITE